MPKKRKSDPKLLPLFQPRSQPLKADAAVFCETFETEDEWEEFKTCCESDEHLKAFIPRCMKLLTPLKYAKLMYDFGQYCHESDWDHISGCFMNGLRDKPKYAAFYDDFKKIYEDLCD